MAVDDPDLPLIQALQGGHDSALDELMVRHREPLFRFIFRYLQNETAAADVVQETFVRVYFKAAKYQPKARVKTWIYTIAVNLCRDYRRRSTVGPQMAPESPVGEQHSRVEEEASDPSPGPAHHAEKKDQFAALRCAIEALPHALKAALVLFSLEGHSQKEAADMLGTTPKTVELRVYRAKEKLRALLGDSFRGENQQ